MQVKGDDLYFPLLDRQNKIGGVNIRAEFAKAAMQGFIAGGSRVYAEIAEASVICADALIEALNKE